MGQSKNDGCPRTERAGCERERLRREAHRRGRKDHRRADLHGRAHPHRAADGWPRAARRRSRPRQDPHGAHALRRHLGEVRAHPVHARPAPCRRHRHGDLQPAEGRLLEQARPRLREPRAGRRDQPRARQGAERPPRGDAGAAGDHRRHDLPAAQAVHRDGDAEPHRAGGHLPPAGGADRPLHAHGQGGVPLARRRAQDHGSHDPHGGADREPCRHDRRAARGAQGGRSGVRRREGEGLHRGRGVRDARAQEGRPQGPRPAHRLWRLARARRSPSTWPRAPTRSSGIAAT